MRFQDAIEERAFLDREAARYPVRQTTIGFLVTAGLWIAIAFWDWIMFPDEAATLIAIHLTVNVPLLLACAAMTGIGGARLPRVVIDWMPPVAASVPGASMLVGQAIGSASYASYVGAILSLYIVCLHSYMGMRFRLATIVSSGLIAGNAALLVAARAPGAVVFNDLGFVLSAQLVGMQISYRTERYRRRDFQQARALRAEQARSERLLHNMLPPPIAERLKRDASTIADSMNGVTVMFADIVGFTELSAKMAPEALVELLNRVFTAFDQLAEKHGVEKIKTIGDAYMAVGGLTVARADHADAVAGLALDMRATLGSVAPDGLAIRIGIHTGPVVAGVIGKSKYVYDLWGDTVNTASRMESHGKPGAIQITEATRGALGNAFLIEERGVVEVKGKGQMRTYWLSDAAR